MGKCNVKNIDIGPPAMQFKEQTDFIKNIQKTTSLSTKKHPEACQEKLLSGTSLLHIDKN
jgi:hypothetical protein